MQQTSTYHLNQWEAEDRILRTDFNADNSKLESALQQGVTALNTAKAALEAALSQEQQARSAGDTSVRQDLSASITQLSNTSSAAISAEQTARTQQDAAIRREFAAADASVSAAASAANKLVKLADITTSAGAAQVDLSLGGIALASYSVLIIIPRLIASCDAIYVRANSNAYSVYEGSAGSSNCFDNIYPYSGGAYATCYLYAYGTSVACRIQSEGFRGKNAVSDVVHSRVLATNIIAPPALQTINFVTNDASAIAAGSRLIVYGVKL
ncbi:hypothetical protein [Oscillibacter sp.]|uniref:hypothetical protein n=1 Tax=Oscillibacter sp. TaxID=1945593 RepID=UPI00262D502B|nr:hypothetical protein [Oscillibacter sp.]MDD3346571.1 hypothetical protein [Oscillibacter sp.]